MRQSKFFHGLIGSESPEVQTMALLSARDIRSNLGSNLEDLKVESGLDPWEYGGERMKTALLEFNSSKVPENEVWKIGLLHKYLTERLLAYYNGLDENEDLNGLIKSLVT